MTETDIKYLAGLLDADGSFFFKFINNRAYLTISLDLSTGIDHNSRYTYWLCEELGVRPTYFTRTTNAKGVQGIKISVCKRATLEKLVPRILKYLVIKGKHLDRLFSKWKEVRGIALSDEEVNRLKEFVKTSRRDVGPIRHKEWLPRAYVAGFLDGDGSYQMKKSSGTYNVSTVSSLEDRVVADLLYKQYGGKLYYQEGWIRWRRPLGRSNKSFAVPFLREMHRHSRLKGHKIELFLNYHSQRLNEKNPTG